MAKTIVYTDTPATHTVKPTQTTFTNNTGKAITLNYQNGTSDSINNGNTTGQISKTISNILYGAKHYYSSEGNDYTIPANKNATITVAGSNIDMDILP